MAHAALRRNGAQDLSVNWLQRYRSEVLSVCTRASHLRIIRSDARQRKRTSELQAAIDIGSGLIKAAGSAPTSAGAEQAPRVRFASSWYTTQEEVFSSHGSRSTYTTLNQVVVERGAMTQDRPYVYVPPIFCDVCGVFVCM